MSATAPGGPLPADFEPYHFLEALGWGALSEVYLAEDLRMGMRVVLKAGRPNLDASSVERFRTEARALRDLNHPNIPRLLHSGTLPDGRPFLATRWVEGTELDRLLESGQEMLQTDAVRIARALARALGYAHERNILHLDIKPANILIPKTQGTYLFDDAQLLDFSVLGQVESDTGTTLAGTVVGTPYFMSPEQVRGEALTPAADIFSLGVVLYRMLAGRLPFEGKNAPEMFHALLSKDPELLPAAVPAQLAEAVMRCLAKDPRQRHASAAALESALSEALNLAPGFSAFLPQPMMQPRPAVSTAHEPGDFPRYMSSTPSPAASTTLAVPLPPSVERSAAPKNRIMTLGLIALGVAILGLVLLVRITAPGELGLIAVGGLLIAAGVGAGVVMYRYLGNRKERATGEVSTLLSGARSREALSMTLSIQVDEVIRKCKLMDEKFLGLTMAVMVSEYDSAKNFDDRQKALMNAIAILDKLGPKLSPWYVRHDKLIATGVSLVGIISGLATAAQSVAKLMGAKGP